MPEQDGLYLTTNPIVNENSQTDEMIRNINEAYTNIANTVNNKDTGIYDFEEVKTGQTFYPDPTLTSATAVRPIRRDILRKVIKPGALKDTDTTEILHGITFGTNGFFVKIYGIAIDTAAHIYLPLPYSSSTLVDNIALRADATKVYITTGSDRTSFSIIEIILEYVKF